jgi:hypothetical protein
MVDFIKLTPEMCSNWSRAFMQVQKQYPWMLKRLVDATTISQTESKLWLISELQQFKEEINNVALLGGWFAHIISPLLIDELNVLSIINYEIDHDAAMLSYKFNRRFKHEIYNIRQRNIMTNPLSKDHLPDTIINTSCEHMFPMKKFKELNTDLNDPLYVLQSTNDDSYEDHINCVSSPEELAEQADIPEIYYKGSKVLDNGMTRFMIIGR